MFLQDCCSFGGEGRLEEKEWREKEALEETQTRYDRSWTREMAMGMKRREWVSEVLGEDADRT